MEWVALSSKYYIDLQDAGISERGEVLLTRALAYMADNATSGHLPQAAIKRLALPASNRRISELLDAGIMVISHDERGAEIGYDFPAWDKWNAPLERQVSKRKADRERVAAKRKQEREVANLSRDSSRDVAPLPNNTRQDLTKVSRFSHLPYRAGEDENEQTNPVSEPEQDTAAPSDEQPGKPVKPDAWKIIRDETPANLGQTVRTGLALAAGELIHNGADPEDVRGAVELWMSRPDAGIGLLPHLYSQVVKTKLAPKQRSKSDEKVGAWLTLAGGTDHNAQKAIP